MGHVVDTCQITSHDDLGSYDGVDSEIKMMRLVTSALRRPWCRSKTRSGASPEEAAHRLANRREPASWTGLETGTSRDGRRGNAWFSFKTSKPPDPVENPGTSTKTSKSSARRGTHRSPMLAHETSPVSGASVVGMLMGHATCRAICRLASQESPRLKDKKTGSTWRVSCANSRLAIPPWKAGARR
jgi:hypothetical protein